MEWIGVIGIIVGLVFFVIAAMKGWNVLITSVVTAVIIAVTNGMGIADAMLGAKSSYVTGLASFVQKNLLIFVGAAILGEYIDKSGAAKSIAQAIVGKVGTKSLPGSSGDCRCRRDSYLCRHLDVRGDVRPHPACSPDLQGMQHSLASVLRSVVPGRLLVHDGHDPGRSRHRVD